MGKAKGILKDCDKAAGTGTRKDLSKPYHPRFCSVVINRGRKGESRAQIAVYLGVTRKRLKAWEDAHPDFKEAMEVASDQALAWWESKAQRNLGQKHFQAGVLNKMMAARYPKDYGDRSTLELEVETPLRVITRRIIRADDPASVADARARAGVDVARAIEHKRDSDVE
jgi:hypothetical protein